MRGDFNNYIRQMMQDEPKPEPTSNPTPELSSASQSTPYPRDQNMSQVLEILQLLQNQVGNPRSNRGGVQLRVSDTPTPPNVGGLVDYMNYDGDPNMGLLKGLFGGRAQPGTPHWKFEEGLGRRGRGR